MTRKGAVPRLKIEEVVASVLLMRSRVKKNMANVVFFPEAGGLLLKYIFQRIITEQDCCNIKIFSSKITAAIKSPLSKQICSILSPAERKKHLTTNQVADFKIAIAKLPQSSKSAVEQSVNIGRLHKLQICELIRTISEIGLYVPSEDRSNWVKAGIINNNNYLPEDDNLKNFQNFRKKMINYSLDSISDIIHETRPLFNIVLAQTSFAKAIHQNTIYVIDEAISRGRALNALEIIFKAFDKDAKWKIGVLFCPLNATGHGNVDFILSNDRIPSFSNRFDLMGSMVLESKEVFVRYDIDKLLLKTNKVLRKFKQKKIVEYFKRIRAYVSSKFSMFLEPGLIYKDDLIRLFNFIFECNKEGVIKRCLDLNPVRIRNMIEEVSFYINMPNPFDPMPIRKKYKDGMLGTLEYIKKIPAGSSTVKELNKLGKEFHSIKRDCEQLELRCWSNRYHKILSEIDNTLKCRKL